MYSRLVGSTSESFSRPRVKIRRRVVGVIWRILLIAHEIVMIGGLGKRARAGGKGMSMRAEAAWNGRR